MVVAVLALGAARPAGAQTSDELQLLTLTNRVRTSVGAPPLALDDTLSTVARSWSATMAVAGTISHNPLLKAQIGAFPRVGENVGVGGTVEAVHDALVASPGHYANLAEPRFTTVGLGVVRSGTRVYLTQVFVQAAGSVPARAQPPAVAPAGEATPDEARAAASATATRAPAPTSRRPPARVPATVAVQRPARTGAPATLPSPWHVSVMGQLAAWDRLLA